MIRRAFALAPVAALTLAACGANAGSPVFTGGATSSASPAAPQVAPKDAVLTAVHHASATSFRADLSMTVSFSTSPTATGFVAALNGQSMTLHMQLTAESAQRNRVDATVTGAPTHVVAILYDGTLYMSTDAGKTFRSKPLPVAPACSCGEDTALSYPENVATVTDEGGAEVDNVSVEDYHADLNPAALTAIVRADLTGMGSSTAVNKLFNTLTLTDGHVDAFVDGSGHIISENGTLDATMDLGALSSSLAGQTVGFSEGFTGDFHDYGASITLTPPKA